MCRQSENLLHTDSEKEECNLLSQSWWGGTGRSVGWVPSWDGGAGDVGPRMRTRRQINGRPEHSPLVHTAAARRPIYRSPYLPQPNPRTIPLSASENFPFDVISTQKDFTFPKTKVSQLTVGYFKFTSMRVVQRNDVIDILHVCVQFVTICHEHSSNGALFS